MKCAYCGQEFEAKAVNAKYCSLECKGFASNIRRRENQMKVNKLDRAMAEARAEGISYEEYKRRKDLLQAKIDWERYEQQNTKSNQ